ncbi:MAG: nucleotidyltransferase domain-containing protein [Deltaproteobacteria bacterium]|nr:nucleotidyltransferase domain-containing protein [Deltaproteobacteria bacterium]
METKLIEKLKEYFSQREDIAFAFLYGSQAKGSANKLSDVDIAVYFYPLERHPIEFEREVFYDGENEIWGDLQRLLKKEVELLVLNRVSASVAASAIRGIPLSIKDWGLYLDFMEVTTDVAEDFNDFVISNYRERIDIEKRDSNKAY